MTATPSDLPKDLHAVYNKLTEEKSKLTERIEEIDKALSALSPIPNRGITDLAREYLGLPDPRPRKSAYARAHHINPMAFHQVLWRIKVGKVKA